LGALPFGGALLRGAAPGVFLLDELQVDQPDAAGDVDLKGVARVAVGVIDVGLAVPRY
jgi:hypothetical protein